VMARRLVGGRIQDRCVDVHQLRFAQIAEES